LTFSVNGFAAIYSSGLALQITLSLNGDGSPIAQIIPGVVALQGSFILKINTTNTDTFSINGSTYTIAHGTIFDINIPNVTVYVFGFKLASASLEIQCTISGGKAHFFAEGGLAFDFFGFATVKVDFHFDSDGNYWFYGSIGVTLGSSSFNIHGNLVLAFASQAATDTVTINGHYGTHIAAGFLLHVDGGVTAFGYDFASIGADVQISGTSVDISVYVSIDFYFFSIGGTVHIHLGSLATLPPQPPPVLARVASGVLYLNLGPDADAYRGTSALSDENYSITLAPGSNGDGGVNLWVSAPGVYSGAAKYPDGTLVTGGPQDVVQYNDVHQIVVTNTGSSNTSIQIAGNVTTSVTIHAGSGTNQFIMGGGASSITGSTGTDKIIGGAGNITFHAGTGKSTFVGGHAHNSIFSTSGVTIVESGYGTYSLSDSLLSYDGYSDALSGPVTVNLTAATTGTASFSVNGYSHIVTLDGNTNANANAAITLDGNLTLNGGSVTESNGGLITLTSIPTIQLYGGAGDNTITVNGWNGGGLVTLDGKNGSDTYNVNFKGSGSQVITVTDSGSSGSDLLAVTSTNASETLNVNTATVTLGSETVNYTGVENLIVNSLGGNDIINVNRPAAALFVNAGNGNDTVNVRATDFDATIALGTGTDTVNVGSLAPVVTGGTTKNIKGLLAVNGAAGGNDTLNIDDSGDGSVVSAVLGNGTLNGIFGAGGSMTYSLITTFNLKLGNASNTLTVAGTGGSTSNVTMGSGNDTLNLQGMRGVLNVNLGAGSNVVNIGSLQPNTGGTLDRLTGIVNLTGNGNDVMNVDDSGSFNAETGILRPTSLTFLDPVTINYTGFAVMNISLSQAGDLFSVVDTFSSASTTPVIIIDGNGGDDIFSVLDTHAVMSINGNDDNDSMYIFGNSSPLNLFGNDGDDSFYIFASVNPNQQNATNLDAGAADSNGNQIYSYRVNAPVNVDGGSGHDKLYIFGTVLNDVITINGTNVSGAGIDVNFTNIEELIIAGLGGDDTFYIYNITVPTTVMGDGSLPIFPPGVIPPDLTGGAPPATSFNDTFFVGWQGQFVPGNIAGINASLMLQGNEGTDTAYIDNSGDRFDRSFHLTGTTLTSTAMGANGIINYDSTVDNLNIQSGAGNDSFLVDGTGAGLQTTLWGGPGNDAFVINAPLTTNLAINGEAGTFPGDTLTINGTGSGNDFVITSYTVDGTGATISYQTVETLTVNGLGGNNSFTLNSDSILTYLNGGLGNDQFTVNGNSVPAFLDGGSGADQFTVNGNSGSLSIAGGIGNDSFTINGNSGGLTVSGGADNDQFVINALSAPASFDGGSGDDAFTINVPLAAVANLAGGGGVDALTINGTLGDDYWVLTASSLSGVGAQINYLAFATLRLNGRAGNDVFNIQSTSAATTLDTGAGLNIINVGNTAPIVGGVINGIQGVLNVLGNGSDVLNIDDSGSLAGKTGTLNSTSLIGFGMGSSGINFLGLAALNFNLGQGGNTLLILNTPAAPASIFGGLGSDIFNVQATPGSTNLSGAGGNDTFNLGSAAPLLGGTLNSLAGAILITGGTGSDTVNLDDTGDTLANTGTLTSSAVSGLGLGGGLIYSTIELLNINLGSGSDAMNIRSTSVGTVTNLNTGGGANTINLGSLSPATGGVLDLIAGPLNIVGSGADILNVDDTGSLVGKTGTLTPTTLTGLGTGGITFIGLVAMNISLGSGDDTFTVNDMTNNIVTTINGGAGFDSAILNFAGDFAAQSLTLRSFETATLQVGGNFTGLFDDDGAIATGNIVGSLTSTGILKAGSIGQLHIIGNVDGLINVSAEIQTLLIGGNLTGNLQAGPLDEGTISGSISSTGVLSAGSIGTLTIGVDMAGLITVEGLLDHLIVNGGTPGLIVAGSVNLITVAAGYGNNVFRVTEGGVARLIIATPLLGGSMPGDIQFAFVYDSTGSGQPVLGIRVTNSEENTSGFNRFNLGIITQSENAAFDLARVDANGSSGLGNIMVDGSILSTVSSAITDFLGLASGAHGGVVLPDDQIVGVEVRDSLSVGMINVGGLEAWAFGVLVGTNGKPISAGAFQAAQAWKNLGSHAAFILATDIITVSFGEKHAVSLFAVTDGDSDIDRVMVLTDQLNDGLGIHGTVQLQPSASPKIEYGDGSVLAFEGDGASVNALNSVDSITSTGSLGDLSIAGSAGLGSVTASSIFGNILVTHGGITGIVQTTGIRADTINGTLEDVSADIGRLVAGRKGAFATTITAKAGLTGQIISRGNLVSQVNVGSISSGAVIAAQGDIGQLAVDAKGSARTDAKGHLIRYGGIKVTKGISGNIVALGNIFGDITAGILTGRIAAQGQTVQGLNGSRFGILGNLSFGQFASSAAIVSGGMIGDAAGRTALKSGKVNGILAAQGDVTLAKSTKLTGHLFQNLAADDSNSLAISSIFTDDDSSLGFDTGGELQGLTLITTDLATLSVGGDGNLTGPTP
jgi:acrosin